MRPVQKVWGGLTGQEGHTKRVSEPQPGVAFRNLSLVLVFLKSTQTRVFN